MIRNPLYERRGRRRGVDSRLRPQTLKGRSVQTMGMLCVLAVGVPASASYQPTAAAKLCLDCHSKDHLALSFTNGTQMSVRIDSVALGRSVHRDLDCSDCHSAFSADEHPRRSFSGRRAFVRSIVGACSQCHEPGQGLHGELMEAMSELHCVDCHGGHGVDEIGESDCMGCHRYRLEQSFANGVREAVSVHPEQLKTSVHGDHDCTDCHPGFSGSEHPVGQFASRRAMTVELSKACYECHADKESLVRESLHAELVAQGHLEAPVCIDCHGSHGIAAGTKEKILSARRCRSCHAEIYSIYTDSVHGRGLVEEHNQEVPVCVDCHQSHAIVDPRVAAFAYQTPQMCGDCHANETLMAKYGLSTAVLDSYLEDFHGVTATYYEKEGRTRRRIAVCTDCHGVHDIATTRGPDAGAVKARLLARCQVCHPDATESFPDAWISHYEPTWERAPLVYLVGLGYQIFIPFMIIGLVLQILLHLWRYAVRR